CALPIWARSRNLCDLSGGNKNPAPARRHPFAVSSMPAFSSSYIAKDLLRHGNSRVVLSCADMGGEQRLRALEVVRYSDVDEEPRANQTINRAVEKAGKNLP